MKGVSYTFEQAKAVVDNNRGAPCDPPWDRIKVLTEALVDEVERLRKIEDGVRQGLIVNDILFIEQVVSMNPRPEGS